MQQPAPCLADALLGCFGFCYACDQLWLRCRCIHLCISAASAPHCARACAQACVALATWLGKQLRNLVFMVQLPCTAGGTSQVFGNTPLVGMHARRLVLGGWLRKSVLLLVVGAWGCQPPCVDSLFCIAVVQPLYCGCRLPGTSHVFGGSRTATPILHAVRACMLLNACLPSTPACKAIRRWLMLLTLAMLSGSGALLCHASRRSCPHHTCSFFHRLSFVSWFAGTQLNPTAHWFERPCLHDYHSVCVVMAS